MAFDQTTRNRLQRFVADARNLLNDEFTRQLQNEFGLNPETGEKSELSKLTFLDDAKKETAEILRETMQHYLATTTGANNKEVLARIVREQAFTILNRMAALRMAEARGILMESIAKGYQSKGFQLYSYMAGTALGESGDAYKHYLFSVFDEFALDLKVLFDRFSSQGRLFPKESTLLALLDLINHPEIEHLWVEDETIGWIYQYFNSKEERKTMRDASQAPRNSRELAVRNQFFTPRYVVEFLTDNTLGRIWYEMTQGKTSLTESCKYLVRRPNEFFLKNGEKAPESETSQEDLSQEELLKEPVYIPFRKLKDPREIKMLDPACGSMHFGLYAFDLFEKIYDEAWEIEGLSGSNIFERNKKLAPLHESYENKESFLKDVPRLIIENNIHGVDIDSRAVQIAGLSLWLRAQKSWHEMRINAVNRPQIQKSNIVCAEPMPGEDNLLKEFTANIQPRVIGQLVEIIFEKMKLAGEAGSLLKIEEEIQDAIKEAREEYNQEILQKKGQDGFLPGMAPVRQPTLFDFADLPDDETFWSQAEHKILNALRDYAEQIEGENHSQKRLFAQDAAKGFAFIDLCRKRFDVVLMNPPFGDASKPSKSYIDNIYLDTKGDIYKAFIECFADRLIFSGFLGIISNRAGFFLGNSKDWRQRVLLGLYRPMLMADLGLGVLDAMVETAAYTIRSLNEKEQLTRMQRILPDLMNVDIKNDGSFSIPAYMNARTESLKRHQALSEIKQLSELGFIKITYGKTIQCHFSPKGKENKNLTEPYESIQHAAFFRLIEASDKERELMNSIHGDGTVFWRNPLDFKIIPSSPFSYWVNKKSLSTFFELEPFSSGGRTTKQGLVTADDFRFVRLFWEVPPSEIAQPNVHPNSFTGAYTILKYRWFPFAKGGEYSPFFSDLHLVVNWKKEGSEICSWVNEKGEYYARPQNIPFYFRPGLTWSRRTSSEASFRPLPAGTIFADKGPAIFTEYSLLPCNLALLQSAAFAFNLSLLLGAADGAARSYEVGIIARTLAPKLNLKRDKELCQLAIDAIFAKMSLVEKDETVHHFLPTVLNNHENSLLTIQKQLEIDKQNYIRKIANCQKSINRITGELYGIPVTEQEAIFNVFEHSSENNNKKLSRLNYTIIDLISYFIGCLLGRWNILYCIGKKEKPELPDPFIPLPVSPSGLLQNASGLPAETEDLPDDYPLRITWLGIIVDDEEHPEYIISRIREIFEIIWKDKALDIEQEACEILNIRSLREYFSKPTNFFSDHLKRYSKSRRQAPIYWQLSTPSCSYSLWIYYHRINDQILYTCVNDFVEPKLKQVSENAAQIRNNTSRTSQEDKELEKLIELELELTDFRNELLRIAKFWKPNLNDGVQITAAPLWKLFQHKPWQKTLKETWQKLEKGDYDWAHLAYSIWPERVKEKCKTDKSLAIAHDLEDLYEEPPEKPKKKSRKKSEEKEV